MVNLVREIELAFRSQSIPISVCEKWRSYPKLEGFDGSEPPDASTWEHLDLPDVLLGEPAAPDPFKLAYFSARLGFRESEYSVSAAINSLNSGDAADWHLSTMTHEMLHGHVRDMLRSVFNVARHEEQKTTEQFWEVVFARFRNHMLQRRVKDFALIDSARSLLLSYCCLVREFGSLTQLPAHPVKVEGAQKIGQMWMPDKPAQLKRQLAEEERNISEIIVHTLDLFYFYFDNFERYNRAVWTSWRNVPVVLRDVRQYVLRMLLAYTSLDEGTDLVKRFARARNQVRAAIKHLDDELKGDPVLKRALELLDLPKKHARRGSMVSLALEGGHPLFRPFFAAVRVVEFARHCLASDRIRQALFKADFVTRYTGDSDFDLDFGLKAEEFTDVGGRSVAEFTAWRARSSDAVIADRANVERRTAWLFIACGSIGNGDTGGSN